MTSEVCTYVVGNGIQSVEVVIVENCSFVICGDMGLIAISERVTRKQERDIINKLEQAGLSHLAIHLDRDERKNADYYFKVPAQALKKFLVSMNVLEIVLIE